MSVPTVKPGVKDSELPAHPLDNLNASVLVIDRCHPDQAVLHSWSIRNNDWYVDITTMYFFDIKCRKLYQRQQDGTWIHSKYSGYLMFQCYRFLFQCGKEVSQTILCNVPLTRFVQYDPNSPATNLVIQLETNYSQITISPFNEYPTAVVNPSDPTQVLIPLSSVVAYHAFRYSYLNLDNELIQVEVFTVPQSGRS